MTQGSFAEILRVLRAQRGLALTEAASRIGIDRHTLRDLELGDRTPRYPTLTKIAEGYGVPVEDLLEEPSLPDKADAPNTGRSESETEEWGKYKEDKDLDGKLYRESAQGFLTRTPSDADRIENLARAAGIVEGYVRRWDAELVHLIEEEIYPYGKGIETNYLFQGIAKALQKSLVPYAVWVTKERSEEVSAREYAASRRLLDAVNSMSRFVDTTEATERQMRPNLGEGLAELQSMLAHESTS
jgi:transcriptional regulator with XRE-family HTH domain